MTGESFRKGVDSKSKNMHAMTVDPFSTREKRRYRLREPISSLQALLLVAHQRKSQQECPFMDTSIVKRKKKKIHTKKNELQSAYGFGLCGLHQCRHMEKASFIPHKKNAYNMI